MPDFIPTPNYTHICNNTKCEVNAYNDMHNVNHNNELLYVESSSQPVYKGEYLKRTPGEFLLNISFDNYEIITYKPIVHMCKFRITSAFSPSVEPLTSYDYEIMLYIDDNPKNANTNDISYTSTSGTSGILTIENFAVDLFSLHDVSFSTAKTKFLTLGVADLYYELFLKYDHVTRGLTSQLFIWSMMPYKNLV